MIFKKLIISMLFLVLILNKTNAQIDTLKYHTFCIAGGCGIFFPSNSHIRNVYNSNSDFVYNVGIRFGDSDSKLFPFIEYSTYTFTDSLDLKTIKLRQKFIKAGLIDYIPLQYNTYLRVKAGICLVSTSENYFSIKNEGIGFYMGLGLERRLSREFSYFVDCGYDFRKIQENRLTGDYGGLRVELGLYLNILGKGEGD